MYRGSILRSYSIRLEKHEFNLDAVVNGDVDAIVFVENMVIVDNMVVCR